MGTAGFRTQCRVPCDPRERGGLRLQVHYLWPTVLPQGSAYNTGEPCDQGKLDLKAKAKYNGGHKTLTPRQKTNHRAWPPPPTPFQISPPFTLPVLAAGPRKQNSSSVGLKSRIIYKPENWRMTFLNINK